MSIFEGVSKSQDNLEEQFFNWDKDNVCVYEDDLNTPLHSPQTKERFIEVGEAPDDFEQARQIANQMKEIKGCEYTDWISLSPEQRLDVAQQIENVAATVQHRPPCKVKAKSLAEKDYGYYRNVSKTITLNSRYLDSSEKSYKETLDTIIHEGRHAYQHYNVDVKQVHPSDGDCKNWRENLHSNLFGLKPENYGYQSAQEVGFLRYKMQPVEADARAYAMDVLKQFNQLS